MQRLEKDTDILRIERMERCYDALCAAVQSGKIDSAAREAARELEAYYTGGQWLRDYERDERGAWLPDLKRGVYDLLERADEAMNREKW